MRPSLICVLLAGLMLARAASATQTQSLDEVHAQAEAFARTALPGSKAKYYVTATQLDSRLRLAACTSALEAFRQSASASGDRMTVGVRCPAANTWTVYVPVKVEVEMPVLVLRRALARRARVTQADVEPHVQRLAGSAASFIDDVASLQGHRLRRSLPVGTALTADMLMPDLLVRRGQQVTLIAAQGPVEIRAQGQALSDGAAADRIRVQNVTSLKIVEGVVESDGIVRVGL